MKVVTVVENINAKGRYPRDLQKYGDAENMYVLLYLRPCVVYDADGTPISISERSFFLQPLMEFPHSSWMENIKIYVILCDDEKQLPLEIATQVPFPLPEEYDLPLENYLLNEIPFWWTTLECMESKGRSDYFFGERDYVIFALNTFVSMMLQVCRIQTLARTKLSEPDCNTAALVTLRDRIYRFPARNWNIDEMCEAMNLSRPHLQRIYSDTFGCSCYQDVLLSRLQYADKLLTETNLSVCEIAQNCGFESDSTFIRAFKKHHGCTPTAFRRKGADA